MKKIKITTVAILVAALLNGCAVKSTDSTGTKVLKHTANAPAYAVAAVGMGVQLAIIGTITGVAKLAGAKDRSKIAKDPETKTTIKEDSKQ